MLLASKAAITVCLKKAGNSNVQNDIEWQKIKIKKCQNVSKLRREKNEGKLLLAALC